MGALFMVYAQTVFKSASNCMKADQERLKIYFLQRSYWQILVS